MCSLIKSLVLVESSVTCLSCGKLHTQIFLIYATWYCFTLVYLKIGVGFIHLFWISHSILIFIGFQYRLYGCFCISFSFSYLLKLHNFLIYFFIFTNCLFIFQVFLKVRLIRIREHHKQYNTVPSGWVATQLLMLCYIWCLINITKFFVLYTVWFA